MTGGDLMAESARILPRARSMTALGRVVDHQDQGHALAFVSLGLDDGGNADAGAAEDGGDAGEDSRAVDDVEAEVIAADGLGQGKHGAAGVVEPQRAGCDNGCRT
jgi:hypothetical protein